MDIKKTDRTTLKSYFSRNAVPTTGNFADLIDGMINQREDGIAKLAGEPLSVQAEGDDGSTKKAINFYKSFNDAKPVWTLTLNPRTDANDAKTAKSGWSLGDADGNSKLFVDQATGNVGIATLAPSTQLDVNGIVRVAGISNAAKDPDSGMTAGGNLVIKSNSPQIDFIDTDHNDWSIHVNSNKLYFIRQPWNYQDLVLDGNGNVGIGTDAPVNKLQVEGNLHMDGHSIFLRVNPADFYDVIKWNSSTDRVDIGGWNGVTLGYTQGNPGNVNAVMTVGSNNTVRVNILQLGDKWRLSGIGDNEANDDWLRFKNPQNTAYWGGIAAAKFWTMQGQYTQSDLRSKRDVSTLTTAAQDICKLRGVRFKWRDDNVDDPTSIGLIAQEVETIFPEAVNNGPDGMKGVNYAALIAPLIEAVKEQQEQITRLRTEIEALKSSSISEAKTQKG